MPCKVKQLVIEKFNVAKWLQTSAGQVFTVIVPTLGTNLTNAVY
jgi:hypothetical protein